MNEQATVFDVWAIVEIMGHTRLAGHVTEQTIAGAGILRVDIPGLPATKYAPEQPGFTKFVGMGSIYSITPVSEEIAIRAAMSMRVAPVNVYLAVPQLESGPKWDEGDDPRDGDVDEVDEEEDDNEEEYTSHHYVDPDTTRIHGETVVKVNEEEPPF